MNVLCYASQHLNKLLTFWVGNSNFKNHTRIKSLFLENIFSKENIHMRQDNLFRKIAPDRWQLITFSQERHGCQIQLDIFVISKRPLKTYCIFFCSHAFSDFHSHKNSQNITFHDRLGCNFNPKTSFILKCGFRKKSFIMNAPLKVSRSRN